MLISSHGSTRPSTATLRATPSPSRIPPPPGLAPSRLRSPTGPRGRVAAGRGDDPEDRGADARVGSPVERLLGRLRRDERQRADAALDLGALASDLGRLSGLDLEVVEGLADLLANDPFPLSRQARENVGQLPGLMLACRRPAVGAFRRRYLLALWRTPVAEKKSWLPWEGTTEDRLASAVSLSRALARSSSPSWSASEAKVLWALPAQYRGESPWFALNPRPAAGRLIEALMSYPDPDRWLLGLRRWSTLSISIAGFDPDHRRLLASLASLPEATWRHLAGLRTNPQDLAVPPPKPLEHEPLGPALEGDRGAWLAAVAPSLRDIPGTSKRILALATVARLGAEEVRVGVEWATRAGRLHPVEPLSFLRTWADLSESTRGWVRERLSDRTEVTTELLECLVAAQTRSPEDLPDISRALVELAEEGDLAQLGRPHYQTLGAWYACASDRLPWAKLLRLSTGTPEETRMHAVYGDEVPEDVIAVAIECCRAQEMVDQDDPYYPIHYDDHAIIQACHRAYRLGRAERHPGVEGTS